MKHIELLTGRAGPGGVHPPGAVLSVGDDIGEAEAQRVCASGQAREISQGPEPEKATAPAGEIAAPPKPKAKKKVAKKAAKKRAKK